MPTINTCAKPGVVALLFLTLVSCGPGEQDAETKSDVVRPVKTVKIEQSNLRLVRTYPARVLPAQEAELSFRVSGQIIDLPIFAAKRVEQGELLAKLDTRDLENSKIQLESQLDQAHAQLNAMVQGAREEDIAALEAAIKASEAQRDAAKDQVDRSTTLFQKGVITKAQLDNHQTSLKVAEADLESRQQELIKAEAGSRPEEVDAQKAVIAALEAQYQNAENNLDYASLRAPFSGVIARRDVENFANIQAKEPIATLQRVNRLDLEFDVPGADVARFANRNVPIMKAELDAIKDRVFSASFVDFNTQADTATQTFPGSRFHRTTHRRCHFARHDRNNPHHTKE